MLGLLFFVFLSLRGSFPSSTFDRIQQLQVGMNEYKAKPTVVPHNPSEKPTPPSTKTGKLEQKEKEQEPELKIVIDDDGLRQQDEHIPEEEEEHHPIYKPEPSEIPAPIVDRFPLAAAAHSAADLPSIPPWNRPPKPHVPEATPLFIGFTRNWNLLQQTVVSWVTAGWPPEDIYVFENTGTMNSNALGLLSLQNPFYLNHTRLKMYGVNIVTTPTLLTFAQLQNLYLWTAIQNNYPTYFWGHMDVLALSYEDRYADRHAKRIANVNPNQSYDDYKSIYKLAVDAMRNATSDAPDINSDEPEKPWAIRFFGYDRLALVNRAAFEAVGGWDTLIPYYLTDCDMHDRLKMNGYEYNWPEDVHAGYVFDTGTSLDDLLVLYRLEGTADASFSIDKGVQDEVDRDKDVLIHFEEDNDLEEERKEKRNPRKRSWFGDEEPEWQYDTPGSAKFQSLQQTAQNMSDYKNERKNRNFWQAKQAGGKGEPYYRDPWGFEKAVQMTMQLGRDVYAEKWGHLDCGLQGTGLQAGDEWRVEHDWEPVPELEKEKEVSP
jgi:hypothetical protein